jgi:hypothetical protein
MRVVPVEPSSNSRSYRYVANSNWSSQSSATEPYETPENIRTDLATDQIKPFREHPCRGIARLAATATKHDLYIAPYSCSDKVTISCCSRVSASSQFALTAITNKIIGHIPVLDHVESLLDLMLVSCEGRYSVLRVVARVATGFSL